MLFFLWNTIYLVPFLGCLVFQVAMLLSNMLNVAVWIIMLIAFISLYWNVSSKEFKLKKGTLSFLFKSHINSTRSQKNYASFKILTGSLTRIQCGLKIKHNSRAAKKKIKKLNYRVTNLHCSWSHPKVKGLRIEPWAHLWMYAKSKRQK